MVTVDHSNGFSKNFDTDGLIFPQQADSFFSYQLNTFETLDFRLTLRFTYIRLHIILDCI